MEAFLHGFIVALGLILPLGVQNIFLFTQGATQPTLKRAMPAAITAALCDTLLILIAVGGVSLLLTQHDTLRTIVMVMGVFFLLCMAYAIWHSTPTATGEAQALSSKKQVLFALSVSLLNPHALLDTIGVIGTSALAYNGAHVWLFATACISVSWLVFTALVMIGARVKTLKHAKPLLRAINKCSAVFIACMALYLASTLM